MGTATMKIFAVAGLITVAALITWQTTGGDAYTKFEVVEEVERQLDPNDPLAGTGFYDDDKTTETVTRKEFRLGLIPTPAGLFDKHILAVTTIAGPPWGLAFGFWWWKRRKR